MDIIDRYTIKNLVKTDTYDTTIFLLSILKEIYNIVYKTPNSSAENKLLEINHIFENLRGDMRVNNLLKQKPYNGTVFNNIFKNTTILGEGGYGIVYKGTHYLDNIEYAIKRIPIFIPLENKNISKIILTKLREIRYLAKLNHPNIISYNTSWLETDNDIYTTEFDTDLELDQINTDNSDDNLTLSKQRFIKFHLFYQMELMDCSLREYINNSILKSHKNNRIIIKGILEGLNYLHNHINPIIHFDIKPENILLKIDYKNNIVSKVKIADFGLVHQVSGIESNLGTEIYSSPERKEKIYHPSADIYSLGIIIYEMLNNWKTNMERIEKIKNLKTNNKKIENINIISDMIIDDYNKRPSCKNLLKLFNDNKYFNN